MLCTIEEETRKQDGCGSWRRRGISIVDRRLLSIERTVRFCKPDDYLSLLPENLPDLFTNNQLSALMNVNRRKARKLTYCLKSLRLLKVQGKKGNEQILRQKKEAIIF